METQKRTREEAEQEFLSLFAKLSPEEQDEVICQMLSLLAEE